jgi:raw score 3.25
VIEQKSIRDIIDKKINFNVPAYQRGYRWDKLNVTDLLDDLLEFIQDDNSGKFYCLQPLVVKKIGVNQYNVIDGQQRLATIFIILKYLENLLKEENGIDEIYTLSYETRKDSKDFLQNIANKTQDESNKNIDYFYMYQAYEAVDSWFKDKISQKKTTKRKMLEIFTNSEDEKHIEFIWYEVEKSENDEVKIFARLNSGKIPLTNAELIKALFLNVRNFLKECSKNEIITKQIEISKEWDEIEYTLQDDEFFKFLTKNDYPTRIELLFEILSEVKNTELDRYAIYRCFADMAKEDDLSHIWSDIKKIFLTFKFWFKDIEYYHLVGFLVASNILSIEKIYNATKDKTKNELRDFLKDTIKNNLRLSLNLKEEEIKIDNISGLSYDDDKDKKNIEKILLLFNIATIINSKGSYTRFSFNEYNGKKWSLEHIHAQNDKELKDKKAQDAWLSSVEKYLDDNKIGDKQLAEMIGSFKEDNKRNDFFTLQIEILNRFGDVNMHGIENLALLTAEDNSFLSNGLFIEKREKIIEMDKNGKFIPICTKNVFLKYYSNELSNLYFWSKDDQEDYKGSIIKTLENFLGEKNEK